MFDNHPRGTQGELGFDEFLFLWQDVSSALTVGQVAPVATGYISQSIRLIDIDRGPARCFPSGGLRLVWSRFESGTA